MGTYEVLLWLKGNSQPIVYSSLGLYVKGPYTCIIFMQDGVQKVHKYPTADVFRVEEEYRYVHRRSVQAQTEGNE